MARVLLLIMSVVASSNVELLQDYELVWSDEFNGNAIDRSKWEFEQNCWGGGNLEKQCYIDDTSVLNVSGGVMRIQPRYHPAGYQGSASGCTNDNEGSCTWTHPATSARIRTINSASFLYGRFEMRARMPRGDFLWPAFWMLPTDEVYGTWAASGEIDILEYRGQHPTQMEHTLHFGGLWPDNVYEGSGPQESGVNYRDQFFTVACEWDPDEMRWYINGQLQRVATLNRSFYSGTGANPYTDIRQPFDQRFHMIINVAVAGVGFFPPATYGEFNAQAAAPTWQSPMEVDYVRVYQRGTPPPTGVCNGARADASCCSAASPCGLHEGDCDDHVNHSDCEGNLVCGVDNCNNHGLGFPDSSWDCCEPPEGGCNGDLADASCCSASSPCGLYEGDCDDHVNHSDCQGNLICGVNNCNNLGLGFPDIEWDCCVESTGSTEGPPTCLGGPGVPGWSANATCCNGQLCAINQGQCSADSQCFGALVCGGAGSCAAAWGSNPTWNNWRCCQQPPHNPATCLGPPNTPGWYPDAGCCNTRLCSVYEGQCQSSNQCAGALVCGAPGSCASAWGASQYSSTYANWKCCVTPPL